MFRFVFVSACHLLGDYLESVKKDFEKAGKVYKNNCDDHSYAKSCLKYANFLLLGKGEVKEDYESSYKYFDKACGLNEADACFHQGLLLVTSSNKTKQPEDVLKVHVKQNSIQIYTKNVSSRR